MSFGTFGTAGDAGLRAEAPSLETLLADLALGFAALSSPGKLQGSHSRTVSVNAGDAGELAVRFVNELIYLADTEGFLPAAVSASIGGEGASMTLRAELKGESRAFDRHPRGLLVKAATYHGLKVEEKGGRWRAEIILDI